LTLEPGALRLFGPDSIHISQSDWPSFTKPGATFYFCFVPTITVTLHSTGSTASDALTTTIKLAETMTLFETRRMILDKMVQAQWKAPALAKDLELDVVFGDIRETMEDHHVLSHVMRITRDRSR